MSQDSGFDNNDGKGDTKDGHEPEMLSGSASGVRMNAASGTYRLRIVHDAVTQTLGPNATVLDKLFLAEPRAKILWGALMEIGADLKLIDGRLDEATRPQYFFELLVDYLSTIYIALDVRNGNQKNVHVFQHKDDMRTAAETYASTKDRSTATLLMSKIRAAVMKAEK
ncbi:hypothetical protein IT413_06415 [Candidatus Peregrinibacteria bacterium]|nr:hypothetical protein [Candidatus Peregrinibacteria bacterium]